MRFLSRSCCPARPQMRFSDAQIARPKSWFCSSTKPSKENQMAIVTPQAVLSFANLFSPRPRSKKPGSQAVYSCTLLFSPEAQKTDKFKEMKEACKEVFIDEYGEKAFAK